MPTATLRIGRALAPALLVAIATAAATAADTDAPAAPKIDATGPAYDTLGRLVVMHEGRLKPYDTAAREVVHAVSGRRTIAFEGPDGAVVAKFSAPAALFGWSNNPEYWDDQEIVLVEFGPLKELLLQGPVQARLKAIADRADAPADLKAAIAQLDGRPVSAAELEPIGLNPGLTAAEQAAIVELSRKLGKAQKWLSPRDLEDAQVAAGDQQVPFERWAMGLRMKQGGGGPMGGGTALKLPPIERKAIEVADRLLLYQKIRGEQVRFVVGSVDQYVPRPSGAAAIGYIGAVHKQITEAFETGQHGQIDQLNPVQAEAADTLSRYFKELQPENRKRPGTDADLDRKFSAWLRDDAEWTPLKLLTEADPAEMAKAGYPAAELTAFRDAFAAARAAEQSQPGGLTEPQAMALVASARQLGEVVGRREPAPQADVFRRIGLSTGLVDATTTYPTPTKVGTETHFNSFAPFVKAPVAYLLGAIALVLSLGASGVATGPRASEGLGRTFGTVGRLLYLGGMAAFLAGLGLEVYGFAMRVVISGWAPVTNMYETVIWVGLVTGMLGLVFELITRRRFVALAACGVAFLCTLVAATTPTLLDPDIKAIQPVLRSNYWLTIHVLTIVSSYAAFALALGLGLIATCYYLTATYRRAVPYATLARPLAIGLPALVAGGLGAWGSYQAGSPAFVRSDAVFYVASVAALGGMVLTLASLTALVGEFVSRLLFRDEPALDTAALAGDSTGAVSATADLLAARSVAAGGGVATLARPAAKSAGGHGPSILDRVRAANAAAAGVAKSAREQAMLATAETVKPLANFVYGAIAVGVVLVAAGTILGGVWADYSWGRFWGWDPKEVWALITLVVYLIPLHGRFAGWVNTFGLVVASVVCFSSVLMAWYGVNFVLGVGLHSYGFVEGGSQGLMVSVALAIASFVAGAGLRRHFAQRALA